MYAKRVNLDFWLVCPNRLHRAYYILYMPARLQNEIKNAHIILEAVTNHDHLVWRNVPIGANMEQWSWIWFIGAEFSA